MFEVGPKGFEAKRGPIGMTCKATAMRDLQGL